MIEYVKGETALLTPAYAVVEAHGVGYGMSISLNTYSALQGRSEARLWVYEAVREDAYALYGFATREEREMFTLLVSVSGVGPNTARVILSEMTVEELCEVIATGDERSLKTVKGIGLRTAQRIIVDLKDKLPAGMGLASSAIGQGGSEGGSSSAASGRDGGLATVREEAVGALTMLGFAPAPSAKVVAAILKEQPSLPVEQVVKQALKQIK